MIQSGKENASGNERTVVQIMTTARTIAFLEGHISRVSNQNINYHVIANFEGTPYDVDESRHHVNLSRRIISLGDITAFWQIRRILKTLRPDVVIVSTPKASLIGAVATKLALRNVPTVFLVRGFRFPTLTGLRRWLVRRMETFPSYLATKILVTSKETGETLAGLVGKRNSRRLASCSMAREMASTLIRFPPIAKMFASGLRFAPELGIAPDEFMVLAVGRICVDKGFQELIEAFETSRSKVERLRLVVAGEFYDPDALPQATIDKLKDNANLIGRVPNRKLPEIYQAADLFVYPSRREGFGVAAIEAAAMGVPTLAARTGGLQSAVSENESGLFFEPLNTADLADKLVHLATDRDALLSLQKGCRDYAVNNFDERLYDKFWLEIYDCSS